MLFYPPDLDGGGFACTVQYWPGSIGRVIGSLLADSLYSADGYPLAHDQASGLCGTRTHQTVNVSAKLATLAIWPLVHAPRTTTDFFQMGRGGGGGLRKTQGEAVKNEKPTILVSQA